MHFALITHTIVLFLLFQIIRTNETGSEETNSNALTLKVDAIRNQVKNLKAQITDKYQHEKLLWQLETLQNWYADEVKAKCTADLAYIFNDWTVIQRRLDGSENFYRNWSEYEQGFGDKRGEFFVGLDQLYQFSQQNRSQELLIILGDHAKQLVYAKYDNFKVGSAQELYELKELGSYVGTAGDALTEQIGQKFTTRDRDNDKSTLHNCAKLWHAAWWFGFCHQSHLNGPYLEQPVSEKGERGIVWDLWHGMNYSLKFVLMLVRTKV